MGASMLNLHSKSIGGVYIHDVFGGDNSTPKSPRVSLVNAIDTVQVSGSTLAQPNVAFEPIFK